MIPRTRTYRWRTELRGYLPHFLAMRVPKGRRDCGAHEWYNADNEVDRCYHCSVGVRPHSDEGLFSVPEGYPSRGTPDRLTAGAR